MSQVTSLPKGWVKGRSPLEKVRAVTDPATDIGAPGTISPHSFRTLALLGLVVRSSVPNVAVSEPHAIPALAMGRGPFWATAAGWSNPTAPPITGLGPAGFPQLAATRARPKVRANMARRRRGGTAPS